MRYKYILLILLLLLLMSEVQAIVLEGKISGNCGILVNPWGFTISCGPDYCPEDMLFDTNYSEMGCTCGYDAMYCVVDCCCGDMSYLDHLSHYFNITINKAYMDDGTTIDVNGTLNGSVLAVSTNNTTIISGFFITGNDSFVLTPDGDLIPIDTNYTIFYPTDVNVTVGDITGSLYISENGTILIKTDSGITYITPNTTITIYTGNESGEYIYLGTYSGGAVFVSEDGSTAIVQTPDGTQHYHYAGTDSDGNPIYVSDDGTSAIKLTDDGPIPTTLPTTTPTPTPTPTPIPTTIPTPTTPTPTPSPTPPTSELIVKVDDIAEDGHVFYLGKHTITVEYEGNYVEADIYINDEYVGKTARPWWDLLHITIPKLEYDFQQAGDYTITAIYNDMEDTILIEITNIVDPKDPDAIVIVAKRESLDTWLIGNFTALRGEKICFVVTRQSTVGSIWDWDKISGAQIIINEEPVGITAKTSGCGGQIGYAHVFEEPGVYEVYAEGDFGQTQKIYITVSEQWYTQFPFFNNPIMQFFVNLAKMIPIIGDIHADAILWLIIFIAIIGFVLKIAF